MRELERRNKTVAWLSREMNYGPKGEQRINNWKRRGVPPLAYADLARALGWSIDQLLGVEKDPPPWFGEIGTLYGNSLQTPHIQRGHTDALQSIPGAPVVGIAQVGADGYFKTSPSAVDKTGLVPAFSPNPKVFALRVKGDGWFPVIDDGMFVVVSPGEPPKQGEKVVVTYLDGRTTIKRLLFERADSIGVAPLQGGMQQTIERDHIASIDPVIGVLEASSWRP